jgi:cobalt-zinc-cadmium efflux system outer membrane protein
MKLGGWSFWAVSLAALCGCSYLTNRVDQQINELAEQVQHVDIHPAQDQAPALASEPLPAPWRLPPPPETMAPPPAEKLPAAPPEVKPAAQEASLKPQAPSSVQQAVALQETETKPPPRLVIPPNLPGAKAPELPSYPKEPEKQRKYLQEHFPPLPRAPQLRPAAPGPEGRPLTLADLQRLAATYSPAIKNAESALEAAKGAAKQAGAYPNPSVFFEQDTVGTGPAGYEGFGFHQTIMTGGKLKLQQAAAMMDVLNAQLALKRAYTDLSYAVRTNYFAVLVAREAMKVNQALYEFADEIYRVQIELIPGGFAAPYQALQLRPLALQARFNLIQSQNQYLASWKQLTASLGLRDMPPSELAGQVDMSVPVFDYDEVRDRVLANHTDVRTAYNDIWKARFNLRLAQVTNVPNVDLNVLGQKDTTAPPNVIAHSLQVSLPVPVWNQNLGAIKQATGQLAQAQTEPDVARNNLTVTLADAYNRYATNRENVAITMQQVQDQVRAFRMLRESWLKAGVASGLGFTDVYVAQQTLATYIGNYIAALGLQWTAVCDVANLLQTSDLFQVGPREEMAPVPDLKQLAPCLCLPK